MSTVHFDNAEQDPVSAGKPFCNIDSANHMRATPKELILTKDRRGVTCKRCLLKLNPPTGGKMHPRPGTGDKVIGAGGVPLDTARTRKPDD